MFLRQRGEDVTAVAEIGPGISDQEVLDLACDQRRILLSFDRDHGDLVFNRGAKPPRAIVFFRLYPTTPSGWNESFPDLSRWVYRTSTDNLR